MLKQRFHHLAAGHRAEPVHFSKIGIFAVQILIYILRELLERVRRHARSLAGGVGPKKANTIGSRGNRCRVATPAEHDAFKVFGANLRRGKLFKYWVVQYPRTDIGVLAVQLGNWLAAVNKTLCAN